MNKLIRWWNLTGKYLHREIWEGVKNIIRWLPIIYKDRDWDHYYIWEILKTKLKHQAEYIRKKDRYTMAQYDANKMELCVRLIEKVQSEEYDMEYMDYHKTELQFLPSDVPNCVELEIKEISSNFEDYFDKYPLVWRRCWVCGDKDVHIARRIAQYNHARAKRILFTLLEKHLESWWD